MAPLKAALLSQAALATPINRHGTVTTVGFQERDNTAAGQ
jgi:hypothetical protein